MYAYNTTKFDVHKTQGLLVQTQSGVDDLLCVVQY